MVVASTHPYCVLLQDAQARRRLARIDDSNRQACDGLRETIRRGRDAGEALEEVQGNALGREDRRQWPLDPGERHAGFEERALGQRSVHGDRRVEGLERRVDQRQAR